MQARQYRDRGVVLRSFPLGEADRIVTFITERHGKVRAVAKGVRKTRSRHGGRLEPLRHLDVQFHRGRGDLDVVTGAETRDRWPALRDDLDRLGRAMTLAEAVDQACHDRVEDPVPYRMLTGALRALDRRDAPMLVAAFLLRLLAHEGAAPMLDACGSAGRADGGEAPCAGPPVAFDPALGAVTCAVHRSGGQSVTPEAVALLRAVLSGSVNAVLAVGASEHTASACTAVSRLWEHHIERRLRSTDLLSR